MKLPLEPPVREKEPSPRSKEEMKEPETNRCMSLKSLSYQILDLLTHVPDTSQGLLKPSVFKI